MSNIFKLINNSNSIVILTHESPDGDAIGSSLAFYEYLTSINKSVDIVIQNRPKMFDFLPSINKSVDSSNKKYDLGIIVDTSSQKRIGQNNDIFSNCKTTVVIDHHVSNNLYGSINYVKGTICSCSQVIYYLFKDNNIDINLNMGICLMCGLLTDSDGFKHDDVDYDTFIMAANLKKLGVNVYELYKILLSTKSMAKYELSKIVMGRLEFFENGKIAFSYINADDFVKCGALLGDHEGLVEIGREISGVEVSIFIREENSKFKISLRSNGKVNVNNIAKVFNGGGHIMAAGAVSELSFQETKEIIINETIKDLSSEK